MIPNDYASSAWCSWLATVSDASKFNSSEALIADAKKERARLMEQIEQSQRTIEHSREIIARIDRVLAAADKK